MIELLTEPFQQGIAQRAALALVLIGAVAGPLGVWIVLYRQSYAAESITHAMLPGLALAALVGIPFGIGAGAGLAVAGACIALASRRPSIGSDAAVAVTVTGLFGLGALLALSPQTPPRLGEMLFGDPLAVSGGDLALIAALAVALATALTANSRLLTVAGFDPAAAPTLGAPPARASLILLLQLAATTLIAVGALGNLLVVAILIAPGAAALRLSASLRLALPTAAAIAIGSGLAGIYLSHYASIAAGASVALCACAAYVVTLAIPARAQPGPSER